MSDPLDRLTAALADRYAIEREVGAGGMATVYLARDLRHDRNVAVKVLKPELAAVLGAERFVQEIRTTANLQHPHILPLFDSGEADSFLYYVMPFIEGETLREKLNRDTQLGIEEAVRIASDVADALDYAHRNSVIHRDIKPENILLHDGRPMVADFGIALAVSAAAGGRMTETGLSLGTPHYMSPEQATAEKELSNRSDIYSLAAVLYEMLSGDPPHTGSTAQQIIMKIVTDEARPVTDLRRSVPNHVAIATAKALEKLPADRYATAAEFGETLTGARPVTADMRRHGAAAASGGSRMGRAAFWIAPWLIAAAAVVGVLLFARPDAPVAPPRRFDLVLSGDAPLAFLGEANVGAGQTALAPSHDGTLLVYVGDPEGPDRRVRLYLRDLRDGTLRALDGTDGAFFPFFSPDGNWIAFFVDGQLKKVSVATGQVIALASTPNPYGADWGPDGEIVVTIRDGTDMILVPEAGGSTRLVPATDESQALAVAWPRFLPGGEWVLGNCSGRIFCVRSVKTGELLFITKSGPQKEATAATRLRGTDPRYVDSGHLIYGRRGDGVLAAVAFDAGSFEVLSDEVQLMTGIRRESPLTGRFQLAVSADGTLVWAAGDDASTGAFVWADETGRLDTLPFPRAQYNEFQLSDDGRWIAAVTVSESGRDELRVLDLVRGETFPWRADGLEPTNVLWAPGSESLFVTARGGHVLRVQRGAATGADTVLTETHIYPSAVLDDTTLVALRWLPTGTGDGLEYTWRAHAVRIPASGGATNPDSVTSTAMIDDGGNHLFPELSRDGQWLSYTSNATGPLEVYVMPTSLGGRPVRVSQGGGELGTWSPDGTRLYYRNGREWLYVERTGRADNPFTEPRLFISGGFHNVAGRDHAVSSDGHRLLLLQGSSEETTDVLHVTTNWFEELRQRVPAN